MPSLSKVGSEMLDGALPAISGASLTNLDARDLENALPAIADGLPTHQWLPAGVDAHSLLSTLPDGVHALHAEFVERIVEALVGRFKLLDYFRFGV